MSSRQLRKIRQQQELLKANTADSTRQESSGTEGEEYNVPPEKPRMSMFAALAGDDEDNSNEPEPEQQEETPAKVTTIQPASTDTKKSRKKKKKGKKKQGPVKAEDKPESEDEIDKALKELNIQPRPSIGEASPGLASSEAESDTVLSINLHNLRDIHELRQLFGRDTIASVEQEEREEQRAARRRQHGRPGPRQVDLDTFLRGHPGQKLSKLSLRRNAFIEGREHWPRDTPGGLSMRELKKDGHGKWVEYTYAHDDQYEKKETSFLTLVGLGDPMRLVHLLKSNPYHISTLLQVSFFAKQDDNQSLGAELCERALFTFGRATLSSFRQDLEKGKARLNFRRPENRQFWLAGYHYLKSLTRKGAPRTALEWAKLIFSVDPIGDPYGMNNLIHVLAIKAHESEWLESFMRVFEQSNLHGEIRYYKNTLVLGLLQRQDLEAAKRQLVQNIQSMPWLYCSLFQAINLDAPPSIWGVQPPGEVDEFYTALYIYLTKDMWNYPQATSLLKEAAKEATKPAKLKATDCVLELRTARFVFLEGNNALIGRVPRHYLDRQPNYEFDPLPPSKEENIFSTKSSQLPFEANGLPVMVEESPGADMDPAMGFGDDPFDDDGMGFDNWEMDEGEGARNGAMGIELVRQFFNEAFLGRRQAADDDEEEGDDGNGQN